MNSEKSKSKSMSGRPFYCKDARDVICSIEEKLLTLKNVMTETAYPEESILVELESTISGLVLDVQEEFQVEESPGVDIVLDKIGRKNGRLRIRRPAPAMKSGEDGGSDSFEVTEMKLDKNYRKRLLRPFEQLEKSESGLEPYLKTVRKRAKKKETRFDKLMVRPFEQLEKSEKRNTKKGDKNAKKN